MDAVKLWRCPTCNRVLRERSVARRSAGTLSWCGTSAEAVAVRNGAMWPAYLASLRRCRCGSRRRLKPVRDAVRGQLDLHLDAVVLQ